MKSKIYLLICFYLIESFPATLYSQGALDSDDSEEDDHVVLRKVLHKKNVLCSQMFIQLVCNCQYSVTVHSQTDLLLSYISVMF
jgi:hypothetical protein